MSVEINRVLSSEPDFDAKVRRISDEQKEEEGLAMISTDMLHFSFDQLESQNDLRLHNPETKEVFKQIDENYWQKMGQIFIGYT